MTDDILIGRNGPRNQLWILAALTLPYPERVEALNDIAEMLGSTYALVQSQASRLKAQANAQKASAALPDGRKAPFTGQPYVPSQLRQLTKAELMSGRAR